MSCVSRGGSLQPARVPDAQGARTALNSGEDESGVPQSSAAGAARSASRQNSPATACACRGPAQLTRRTAAPTRAGMGNLGHLVHHLKHVSALIGRSIGADFDRIADARALPRRSVEPTRCGHTGSSIIPSAAASR